MENARTFSLRPDQYANSRPRYPDGLFSFLNEISANHDRAWDCATGSGQAAVSLTEYFSQVEATDISAEQIQHCITHPKIVYSVCSAEKTSFEDQPFDLIAVAQAIHWFDQPQFFREANRLLKPGGILAVWGYSAMTVTPEIDSFLAEKLDELINPFWADGNRQLMDGYPDLRLPFDAVDSPRPFAIEVNWNMPQLLEYIRTWSAVKRYAAKHGSDPVAPLEEKLQTLWKDSSRALSIHMPLTLKLSRKPA